MVEDLLVRNLPEIRLGQPSGHSPLWLLSSLSGDLTIRYSVQAVTRRELWTEEDAQY
jgi:hypothetical protein